MAFTPLVIGSQTFQNPAAGTSPPYGQNLYDIITALAAAVNNTVGPADILPTTYVPANNVASPTSITGLVFSNSTVRGAIITYSVYRNTSITEYSETGTLAVTYKSVAATWEIAQYSVGSSGLTFTISNSGQVQFVSDNMSGTGYTSKLIFSAKAILQ